MNIDLKAIFTGMGCWTTFGLVVYGIYRLGKSIDWPKVEWPLWMRKTGDVFGVMLILVFVVLVFHKLVVCAGVAILGYEIPSCQGV